MAQRLESRKLLTFFFQLSEIVLQVEFTSSGRQDALVGRLKSCKTFSTLMVSSLRISMAVW